MLNVTPLRAHARVHDNVLLLLLSSSLLSSGGGEIALVKYRVTARTITLRPWGVHGKRDALTTSAASGRVSRTKGVNGFFRSYFVPRGRRTTFTSFFPPPPTTNNVDRFRRARFATSAQNDVFLRPKDSCPTAGRATDSANRTRHTSRYSWATPGNVFALRRRGTRTRKRIVNLLPIGIYASSARASNDRHSRYCCDADARNTTAYRTTTTMRWRRDVRQSESSHARVHVYTIPLLTSCPLLFVLHVTRTRTRTRGRTTVHYTFRADSNG